VVWEPILPTDWRRPTSFTLARISDPRAAQFWDPHHLVSLEIQRSIAANHIAFAGHTGGGNLWDLAAVYAPNASFNNALPAPLFIDGPVVDVISQAVAKTQQLLANPRATALLHFAPACALINSSR